MILKKDATPQINYLEDWPLHYYEIESIDERRSLLAKAIKEERNIPEDTYRMKLLEKRYGKSGKNDAFMRAWMINASGSAGISFLNKRHLQKELKQYMQDFSY